MSKKTIVDFGANMAGLGQSQQFGSFFDATERMKAFDPSGYLIAVDGAVPGSDETVATVRPRCHLCGQPGHDGICFVNRQRVSQAEREAGMARTREAYMALFRQRMLDAEREGYAARAREPSKGNAAPKLTTVETVERKPRVIELEDAEHE